MKYIAQALLGLGVAVYIYRTVKKALNEPPEETRVYSDYAAQVLDLEDSWFDSPEDYNG